MPDTYGSPFDQCRGFVCGSWSSARIVDENVARRAEALLRIGIEDFRKDVLSRLTTHDVVMVLDVNSSRRVETTDASELTDLVRAIVDETSANVVSVRVVSGHRESCSRRRLFEMSKVDVVSRIALDGHADEGDMEDDGPACAALKVMLNAISTYAQSTGRGCVMGNRMIATGPTNDKIYDRCVRLIREVVPDVDDAEECLKCAIHDVDRPLPHRLASLTKVDHIRAATPKTEEERRRPSVVLPRALLLATGKHTVATANESLSIEPRVSRLLRRNMFETRPDALVMVGVDLGATTLRVGLVSIDRTGSGPDARRRQRWTSKILRGPVSVRVGDECDRSFDAVTKLIARLAREVSGKLWRHVRCVAVGQPGQLDEVSGVVTSVNYEKWEPKRPFRDALSSALPTTIRVEVFEDADCATAAEAILGRYAGGDDDDDGDRPIVVVTVGTGIGVGVCVRGEHVLRGSIEGGHMIIGAWNESDNTRRVAATCGCGQIGCLEQYCSGSSIQKRLGVESVQVAIERARRGDETARRVLDDAAKALAVGLLNFRRAYDPKTIVLCGGMAEAMLSQTRVWLKRLSWNVHDDDARCALRLGEFGDASGVVGAVVLAARRLR